MAGVMDSVNQLTELVGQNRMELLLFRLSGRRQRYGINVFKVREVLPCPNLTIMPRLHKFVVGVAQIRGKTISVIDLAYAIGGIQTRDFSKSFMIITEYNRSTQGFLVSDVERIVNMNWNKIMPPPKGAGHSNYMTSVTEIDSDLVEILDVEKILDEISPLDRGGEMEDAELVARMKSLLKPGAKVLVADDSKVAMRQTSGAVERLGLPVIQAHDGREALEILRELAEKGSVTEAIEMVISDVEMPELDGYSLCAAIRHDPQLRDLYVILHTSLSGVFNDSMLKRAGANDFIPKFNPDGLKNAVIRAVEAIASGINSSTEIMTTAKKKEIIENEGAKQG